MAKSNGSRKQSFWTTLPGILTAIASLVTAVGGVLAVVISTSSSHSSSSSQSTPTTSTSALVTWESQANSICATQRSHNYPLYNTADSPAQRATELYDISVGLDTEYKAINALEDLPQEDQATVTGMLNYWYKASGDAYAASQAATDAAQDGRYASAYAQYSQSYQYYIGLANAAVQTETSWVNQLQANDGQGNALATDVNLGTCASGNL